MPSQIVFLFDLDQCLPLTEGLDNLECSLSCLKSICIKLLLVESHLHRTVNSSLVFGIKQDLPHFGFRYYSSTGYFSVPEKDVSVSMFNEFSEESVSDLETSLSDRFEPLLETSKTNTFDSIELKRYINDSRSHSIPHIASLRKALEEIALLYPWNRPMMNSPVKSSANTCSDNTVYVFTKFPSSNSELLSFIGTREAKKSVTATTIYDELFDSITSKKVITSVFKGDNEEAVSLKCVDMSDTIDDGAAIKHLFEKALKMLHGSFISYTTFCNLPMGLSLNAVLQGYKFTTTFQTVKRFKKHVLCASSKIVHAKWWPGDGTYVSTKLMQIEPTVVESTVVFDEFRTLNLIPGCSYTPLAFGQIHYSMWLTTSTPISLFYYLNKTKQRLLVEIIGVNLLGTICVFGTDIFLTIMNRSDSSFYGFIMRSIDSPPPTDKKLGLDIRVLLDEELGRTFNSIEKGKDDDKEHEFEGNLNSNIFMPWFIVRPCSQSLAIPSRERPENRLMALLQKHRVNFPHFFSIGHVKTNLKAVSHMTSENIYSKADYNTDNNSVCDTEMTSGKKVLELEVASVPKGRLIAKLQEMQMSALTSDKTPLVCLADVTVGQLLMVLRGDGKFLQDMKSIEQLMEEHFLVDKSVVANRMAPVNVRIKDHKLQVLYRFEVHWLLTSCDKQNEYERQILLHLRQISVWGSVADLKLFLSEELTPKYVQRQPELLCLVYSELGQPLPSQVSSFFSPSTKSDCSSIGPYSTLSKESSGSAINTDGKSQNIITEDIGLSSKSRGGRLLRRLASHDSFKQINISSIATKQPAKVLKSPKKATDKNKPVRRNLMFDDLGAVKGSVSNAGTVGRRISFTSLIRKHDKKPVLNSEPPSDSSKRSTRAKNLSLTPGKSHTVLAPVTPSRKEVRRKSDGLVKIPESPDVSENKGTPRRKHASISLRRRASFYSGQVSKNILRAEENMNISRMQSSIPFISSYRKNLSLQRFNSADVLFPHLTRERRQTPNSGLDTKPIETASSISNTPVKSVNMEETGANKVVSTPQFKVQLFTPPKNSLIWNSPSSITRRVQFNTTPLPATPSSNCSISPRSILKITPLKSVKTNNKIVSNEVMSTNESWSKIETESSTTTIKKTKTRLRSSRRSLFSSIENINFTSFESSASSDFCVNSLDNETENIKVVGEKPQLTQTGKTCVQVHLTPDFLIEDFHLTTESTLSSPHLDLEMGEASNSDKTLQKVQSNFISNVLDKSSNVDIDLSSMNINEATNTESLSAITTSREVSSLNDNLSHKFNLSHDEIKLRRKTKQKNISYFEITSEDEYESYVDNDDDFVLPKATNEKIKFECLSEYRKSRKTTTPGDKYKRHFDEDEDFIVPKTTNGEVKIDCLGDCSKLPKLTCITPEDKYKRHADDEDFILLKTTNEEIKVECLDTCRKSRKRTCPLRMGIDDIRLIDAIQSPVGKKIKNLPTKSPARVPSADAVSWSVSDISESPKGEIKMFIKKPNQSHSPIMMSNRSNHSPKLRPSRSKSHAWMPNRISRRMSSEIGISPEKLIKIISDVSTTPPSNYGSQNQILISPLTSNGLFQLTNSPLIRRRP